MITLKLEINEEEYRALKLGLSLGASSLVHASIAAVKGEEFTAYSQKRDTLIRLLTTIEEQVER